METYNMKDLWICPKCGRFGYTRFGTHTKRIGITAKCTARPMMYNTWRKKKK